ncbi:hypothetical protein HHK36_010652 [Tetracentron sinense]|uniref:Uncharacterized protein n=1 Tax=Tetracentron sinense TaxID=13715 RepID=A0A834ZAT5_TETSI|nr:hypothetical protein HHK36_010652 [Tetracentron sinense]
MSSEITERILEVLCKIVQMGACGGGSNSSSLPCNNFRKRKSRARRNGCNSVAETLAKWKEYNDQLNYVNKRGKRIREVPAKGSKKGCMKESTTTYNHFEVCVAEDPKELEVHKIKPEDGEAESRTNSRPPAVVEAAMPTSMIKEEPIDVMDDGVFSGFDTEPNYLQSFSMEEDAFDVGELLDTFDVDELLGAIDADPRCGNSGPMPDWNYNVGEAGFPDKEQLQCGLSSDISYEFQNSDAKLLGSEQAPSDVDYRYDILKLVSQDNDYNFGLDEQELLDLGFPSSEF